jgi:hypothetical protein
MLREKANYVLKMACKHTVTVHAVYACLVTKNETEKYFSAFLGAAGVNITNGIGMSLVQ